MRGKVSHKEILMYGASKMGDDIFEHYMENFARKRAQKKIMMKAVLEKGFSGHMADKEIRKYTKVRTLDIFDKHNSAYFIYGDNLLVVNLGNELFATRIKSPILAESQRNVFDLLWRVARR